MPESNAAMERSRTGWVATATGIAAVAVGAVVFAGWIYGIPALTMLSPDLPSMRPNSAVCFVFAGAALVARHWRVATRVLASVPIVLGGATAAEHAFGVTLGIDGLFYSRQSPDVLRMPPTTTACFILVGIGIWLLTTRRARTSHTLALSVFVIAMIALVGYLFGTRSLYSVPGYTAMSLHTSLTLIVLAVGLIASHPYSGVASVLWDSGVSGVMVRRTMPWAIALPIAVGYVVLTGERAGLYAETFAMGLAMVATVILLGALMMRVARQLVAVDQKRAEAEQRLRDVNTALEATVEERTAEVAESAEAFRATAESASDAFVLAEETGIIVNVNSAAEEMFGRPPTDIVGSDIRTLMPERFHSLHRTAFERFIQTGEGKLVGGDPVEVVGLRSDGTEFPIELSLGTWMRRGRPMITGVLRDISHRKAAEESVRQSEMFFRLIAENVSDLILRMDTDGKITYASPACEQILGYRPDEVEGRHLVDLVPAGEKDAISRVRADAVDGTPARTERLFLRKDGTTVWLGAAANPITDPETRETTGTIWLLRDVTAQVEALEHQREIARREQELSALKNDFVGIVAHDLKSPMSVIAGFAELLASRGEELTEDQRIEFLTRIRTNIGRLSALVDDVLQVARIESGELTCVPVRIEVETMLRRICEEVSSTHPGRSCEVSVAADLPSGFADEDHVWRIVTNLLSNAFKFSEAPRPVEVSAGPLDGAIHVSVCDHGHGIRDEDLPKLFERFSRVAQPEGKRVAGTGLGLYITKSLIERNGGRIWIDSKLGEGTTVHFTIPNAEAIA